MILVHAVHTEVVPTQYDVIAQGLGRVGLAAESGKEGKQDKQDKQDKKSQTGGRLFSGSGFVTCS